MNETTRKYTDTQVFPAAGKPEPKGIIKVVQRLVTEPDGSTRDQYIWQRGEFVSTAIIVNDQFKLKKEFKYGVMDYVLTFAAGGVKKGESPDDAALRELRAEFGHENIIRFMPLVGNLVNSPDKTTERQHIYLAEVTEEAKEHEPGEIVYVPVAHGWDLLNHPQMTSLIQRLTLVEALRHLGGAR